MKKGEKQRRFLPYGRQDVNETDIAAVSEVLRSDYLTTGPEVVRFEEALAANLGVNHVVVCSSGTAALHLSALALGLGSGDTVVVPSLTFAATANAFRLVGAEVIFADVAPRTGLLTPDTLASAIDGRSDIAAVAPVHLAGQPCDMFAISQIAGAAGASVVEDASHALGTRYRHGGEWVGVGSCQHGDATTFSFHPVKTVAMGEGGAVVTNDDSFADRLRLYRSHGIRRRDFEFNEEAVDDRGAANPWYYEVGNVGLNYRANDIGCALARSQLGRLDQFVAKRRDLVEAYRVRLRDHADWIVPIDAVPDAAPGWHLFPVLIEFEKIGMSRAELMTRLRDQGVGTQVHYIPLHRQPYFVHRYGRQNLPGADSYYEHTLSLPLFSSLKDDDLDYVVEVLVSIVSEKGAIKSKRSEP